MTTRLSARRHNVMRLVAHDKEGALNCGDARTATTLVKIGLLKKVDPRWDSVGSYELTVAGTAYAQQYIPIESK